MTSSHEVVVFVGPTIDHETVQSVLPATCLPPAAAGDVYAAARARPAAIGIVDGLFHTRASIFHKEILWALEHGVAIYGASSMGALRAAETAAFGTIGVGMIFEQFMSGELTDDDEVAVAHLGADRGHRATSEAMVNIRATVEAAVGGGVLGRAAAGRLVAAAKSLHYPDRSLAAALRLCSGAEGGETQEVPVDVFRSFLDDGGYVDQKRIDAEALLRRMGADLAQRRGQRVPAFDFARTAFFEATRYEVDRTRPSGSAQRAMDNDVLTAVITELQLRPGFRQIYDAALGTVLARRAAEREGYVLDDDSIQQVARDFWEYRDITDIDSVESWVQRHELDDQDLADVVIDYARREWARGLERHSIRDALVSNVHELDEFDEVLARARRKATALEAAGLAGMAQPIGCSDDELWQWWFSRQQAPRPSNLTAYARARGFAEDAHFRSAVIDEYHFVTRLAPDAAAPRLAPDDITRTTSRERHAARQAQGNVVRHGAAEAAAPDRRLCGRRSPPTRRSRHRQELATMSDVFDHLFGDISVFAAKVWNRRATVSRAVPSDLWAELLPVERLDELVASRRGDLHLLRNGAWVDRARYTLDVEPGPMLDRTSVIDSGGLLRLFSDGSTLVLHGLHEWWPPLDRFCADLGRSMSMAVQANAYVAPLGLTGHRHHDLHHVIVLQLHGAKRWTIEQAPSDRSGAPFGPDGEPCSPGGRGGARGGVAAGRLPLCTPPLQPLRGDHRGVLDPHHLRGDGSHMGRGRPLAQFRRPGWNTTPRGHRCPPVSDVVSLPSTPSSDAVLIRCSALLASSAVSDTDTVTAATVDRFNAAPPATWEGHFRSLLAAQDLDAVRAW